MKKIISEDSRIISDKVCFYHLADLRIVQHVARIKGFDITLSQANEVWEQYSNTVSASFVDVGFKYIANGEDGMEYIWNCISPYFPEINEDIISNIKECEESTDTKINFEIW